MAKKSTTNRTGRWVALSFAAFAVLVLFAAGTFTWQNYLSSNFASKGTVIDSSRRVVIINAEPFVGSSCSVSAFDSDGQRTQPVDGEGLGTLYSEIRNNEGQPIPYDALIEIDAETETYIGECCPVIPEPECVREELIRINKIYSTKISDVSQTLK